MIRGLWVVKAWRKPGFLLRVLSHLGTAILGRGRIVLAFRLFDDDNDAGDDDNSYDDADDDVNVGRMWHQPLMTHEVLHHEIAKSPEQIRRTYDMPANIPFENHGACSVALIAIKSHPNRVYHYSKTSGQEESWALRDYIAQEILRSGDSAMTASEIENLVDDYSEEPAYRSVKLITRWKADCQAASERHYGAAHVDLVSRNPSTLGNWRRMNSQGS